MGGLILCLFSTVCRFLSTRIMCLGNCHICTVHSYILQVFLFDLSCPDHAPVSGQQGDGKTTSRECWGSQGSSSGWCGMSEIIMSVSGGEICACEARVPWNTSLVVLCGRSGPEGHRVRIGRSGGSRVFIRGQGLTDTV